ncbi:hypothetical protein [Acidianus manzaensis]|uniref:Uncharacterized protein n=1 Tax=Acidianus manzaensis TaxID=282676 RepID=A0A1W6JWV9_9CREN|nr:hypothetical protein [Acidianus manzaensis]ARM74753.1 hypothetical protein B6F84_01080 [Acidianus manzaensis]
MPIKNKISILFLLLLLFSIVSLQAASINMNEASTTNENISVGSFFLYNVTDYMVLPNGSITIFKQMDLFRILAIYSNDTIEVSETIYNVNSTNYFAPFISLSNASVPVSLYYISPSLLGKNVSRGGILLQYVGKNGLYEYRNISGMDGISSILTMWFNNQGIGVKVNSVELGTSYQLVDNSTSILWLTNYNNSNITLPSFKGYTLAHTLAYNISANYEHSGYSLGKKIMEYITIIGIIGIIVILIFRK